LEPVSLNQKVSPFGGLVDVPSARTKEPRRVTRWNRNAFSYTFMVVCWAGSARCVAVKDARNFAVETRPHILFTVPYQQDVELTPSQQEELSCALSNVLEFRPERERTTDRDLERNLPSYFFPE
jgi:hypothetical protein